MNSLQFDNGSTLTIVRVSDGPTWDKLGDRQNTEISHAVGPCSIVDSHGRVNLNDDGTAQWVGTVTVEAPPESDVKVTDRVILPSGEPALVVQPPERPVNPFTGWCPFLKFTLASPGYVPST